MNLAGSQYWDLFEERIVETVDALSNASLPPLRRLSLHITNKCNLKCSYCNECHTPVTLERGMFQKLCKEYDEMGGGVLHITGGEPACVPWLFEEINRYANLYNKIDFHVNTNLIIDIHPIVLSCIKRLKVSLDSSNGEYFDDLVGIKGSFEKVVKNLEQISNLHSLIRPITSITYTMTHENYTHIPAFLEMYYEKFSGLYAVFFSTYKGTNERFKFTSEDISDIVTNIKPQIDAIFDKHGDSESKFLFHASHDETTFADDVRFIDNKTVPCYLQLSELVVNEAGDISNCSHLFRDGVGHTGLNLKDGSLSELFKKAKGQCGLKVMSEKCLYGCNKKLVTFNKEVQTKMKEN
jgi:MoaA/NifB/PqqE/SkfB family radical SAM enzyme